MNKNHIAGSYKIHRAVAWSGGMPVGKGEPPAERGHPNHYGATSAKVGGAASKTSGSDLFQIHPEGHKKWVPHWV